MENKKDEALLSKAFFSMNGAELLELLRQVTESEVKEDKFHSLPNDYLIYSHL